MLKEILEKMQVDDTIVIMIKKEKHRYIGVTGTYTQSIQSGIFEGKDFQDLENSLTEKTIASLANVIITPLAKEKKFEAPAPPVKEKVVAPKKTVEKPIVKQPATLFETTETAANKMLLEKEKAIINSSASSVEAISDDDDDEIIEEVIEDDIQDDEPIEEDSPAEKTEEEAW